MTFKKCTFIIRTIILFYIVISDDCIIFSWISRDSNISVMFTIPIMNNPINISDWISEHIQGMLGLSWLNIWSIK